MANKGQRATVADLEERIQVLTEELNRARESELQFRQLVDNIREVLWISSEDYRHWIYVSPAFESIWGRPASDLGETMGMSTIHRDDRAQFFEAMPDGRLKEKTEFVYRILSSDGTWRWVRTRAFPIRNETGEIYRLGGITEDITEQRNFEEALKQSEERHRLVAANIADLVWTTDLQLRYTYMSPSAERVHGYTAEEMMALTLEDLMPSASVAASRRTVAKALADEAEGRGDPNRVWRRELEVYNKARQTFWAELTWRFMRDDAGKPIGILGLTRDISERKRAEEALRQSEERFRTLVNNIPLGVYRTQPSGEIETANPALLAMLGYESLEELKRRDLEREGFDSAASRDAFKETIERDGEVNELESKWVRRDGSIIHVRESARSRRDEAGQTVSYEGIVEDITERKRAEEALRAAQREREQFYRFLVHDLNKPLAAIIGFSTDLHEVPELSPNSRTLASRIQSASIRLRNIVAQVLELEKIRRGEMEFQLQDFDLWHQIREIVGLLEIKDKPHHITLAGVPLETAAASPPVWVHSDLTGAGRVVQNLIDNAFKYGRSLVEINVTPDAEGVIFSVRNDGPWIPTEYQEAIFSEFYRLPGGRKREGTGLGLASARHLLNLLGGKIWVESAPERGTTFCVRFPKAVGAEPGAAVPQSDQGPMT